MLFSKITKTRGFSKRSLVQTQIFIYVVAIILFSLILVYGYNAIKGFKERSEQISYIKFKTDLVSTIKRISSDYGTLKREEFFIGGEYKKVCFVRSYKRDDDYSNILNSISDSPNYDPLIYDSVENNVTKNVFLLTTGVQESFDIGEISITDGYLCIPLIKGKAKIQFLGQGDHTLISTWSD